jgi:hypothetical protein
MNIIVPLFLSLCYCGESPIERFHLFAETIASLTEKESDSTSSVDRPIRQYIIEEAIKFAKNEGSDFDHIVATMNLMGKYSLSLAQFNQIVREAITKFLKRPHIEPFMVDEAINHLSWVFWLWSEKKKFNHLKTMFDLLSSLGAPEERLVAIFSRAFEGSEAPSSKAVIDTAVLDFNRRSNVSAFETLFLDRYCWGDRPDLLTDVKLASLASWCAEKSKHTNGRSFVLRIAGICEMAGIPLEKIRSLFSLACDQLSVF